MIKTIMKLLSFHAVLLVLLAHPGEGRGMNGGNIVLSGSDEKHMLLRKSTAAKTVNTQVIVPNTWEEEMKKALSELDDELEIVRQRMELEEENEDAKDGDDEMNIEEDLNENNFFVDDEEYELTYSAEKTPTIRREHEGTDADEEEHSLSRRSRRGRRTKQQQWFAKASKKISQGEGEELCDPNYITKEWYYQWQGRCGSDWQYHWPYCLRPCSHYGGEWYDIGMYCYKSCTREGQLSLHHLCSKLTKRKTCAKNSGTCALEFVTIALDLIDVLTNILSAGVAWALKNAIKTAMKAGSKMLAKKGIKEAIKKTAKVFAKKIADSSAIKRKIAKYKKEALKELNGQVMEQGSELFLAASMGTVPDFNEIADEVVMAVDPTGVYGLIKGFVPPVDCDEMVYMSEDIPLEVPGLPDLDPLDAIDDDQINVPGYIWKPFACVSGYNIKLIHNLTPQQCGDECNKVSNCKGFEYYDYHGGSSTRFKPNDCHLQSGANTAGCDGRYYNLDMFIKK